MDDLNRRRAGLLLDPSYVYGFGWELRRVLEWMHEAGLTLLQNLPFTVPDRYGCPYNAGSAFANNVAWLERPELAPGRRAVNQLRENYPWAKPFEANGGSLVLQAQFLREWMEIRALAESLGIRLMGDIPMYVARGSVDQLSFPKLFRKDGMAGAAPDPLNWEGQAWGQHLYDWEEMARTDYWWWTERMRWMLELFHDVRFDHIRAVDECWVIANGGLAKDGHYERGPGRELFDVMTRRLGIGQLPILAEDLGDISDSVHAMVKALGYANMAVYELGFDGHPNNPHRPDKHHVNQAVYNGTHDLLPVVPWYWSLDDRTRAWASQDVWSAGLFAGEQVHWSFMCLALRSPAKWCIFQAQDLLGHTTPTNSPGVAGNGSWGYRFPVNLLTSDLAGRMHAAVADAERL